MYVKCTHTYESVDSNPVLRFLCKGMFNSNAYQNIGYSPGTDAPVHTCVYTVHTHGTYSAVYESEDLAESSVSYTIHVHIQKAYEIV